jgi:hypothetical protein
MELISHSDDQASDSGLASYVAGQIDRTLSWKVASRHCQSCLSASLIEFTDMKMTIAA